MIDVVCPVCSGVLETEQAPWCCAAGHSFDMARQGYVNLLTVTQKHSKNPGDTLDQVSARKEFLDAGYYEPIAQTLCRLVSSAKPETVLDVGCGEGYYLTNLGTALPEAELWGVDISKQAVRYAAVRNKKARWLTATAARLPFRDGSFDCLISMFALTAEAEFRRLLKPGGLFLQVLAGPDHLMNLKRLIYPEIFMRKKEVHPALSGFTLAHTETLEFSFTLKENREIWQLLAMTPHYMRIGKEGADRARAAQRLEDTAQVVFNCYHAV